MVNGADGRSGVGIVGIALVVEGILLGAALGLGTLLGTPVLAGLRLDLAAAGLILLSAAASYGMTEWGVRTSWRPIVALRVQVVERVAFLFEGSSTPGLVVVSAAAGIGEEAFFRGFLQTLVGECLGWIAGLLLVSMAFGLVHWISPTYALLAGLIGLALGALYLVSGNLLVPVVAHAVHDVIGFAALRRLLPPAAPSAPAGD